HGSAAANARECWKPNADGKERCSWEFCASASSRREVIGRDFKLAGFDIDHGDFTVMMWLDLGANLTFEPILPHLSDLLGGVVRRRHTHIISAPAELRKSESP